MQPSKILIPSHAFCISMLSILASCSGDPTSADTRGAGGDVTDSDSTADSAEAGYPETTGNHDTTGDPGTTGDPSPEAVVNPDAIVIEQALADAIIVGEDSLKIPLQGFDGVVEGLIPGAIVVGPPHSSYADTNPAGFLRKVEQVAQGGEYVEVITTQATLEDVFEEADLDLPVASPEALFTVESLQLRDQPWLEIFEAPPMLEGGIGVDFSGKTLVDEPGVKVTLDKGYLRVKPDLALKVKIGWFKLKYLYAEIKAPYDAGLAVSANLDFVGNKNIQATLVDNKKIATTKFKIAGIPITIVLRMTVDVSCDLSAEAKAEAGAGVRFYGSPSAGVKYESKKWSTFKNLDFNHKEAAGAEVFAEAKVACEAPRVRFEYKLFDIAGPYASVAPTLDADLSASFDAQTCEPASCAFNAQATPGVKFVLGFLVKVLGKTLVDKSQDYPLTWDPWSTSWACDAGWLDQNCEAGPVADADLAMTPECFVGADVESIEWGDAQCANAFGAGWKWLEFHHDGGWQSAGKWRDAVGIGERGWVNINDQPAECFESGSSYGLTWIRESEDSTSACLPGTGLEGPEFQPHSGECNPYGGDTPCSMCRRLVCSAG